MKRKLANLFVIVMAANIAACGIGKEENNYPVQKDIMENIEIETDTDTISEETISDTQSISGTETPIEEETVSATEIFLHFLNGETDAMFDADFQDSLHYICKIYDYESGESSYTFNTADTLSYEQLISAIEKSDSNFLEPLKVEKSYAIFNISGKEIFALKFQNLGIYTIDDGSYALFLLTVNNGQLYITYAYDSWARSYTDIYDHLILKGAGSGGAGDSSEWCSLIDGSGHQKTVYDMRYLYDEWVTSYGQYTLNMDPGWSYTGILILLTTSDGNYYWYEADDSVDSETLGKLMNHLEENGNTRIENIDTVLDATLKENDIPKEGLSIFDGWIQCD